MPSSLRLYLPIALIILVALAGAAYFSWIGDYLGASLLGPDIGSTYVPLVRHAGSFHCYDDGSNFCEERFQPGFEKEFTLGYVATTTPRIPHAALYSCAGSTLSAGEGYHITTNKDECTDRDLRPYRLGFIFSGSSEPAIEAPAALYRCSKGTDILLTDDSQDCALGEYGTPEKLGYVASAGYLANQQLAQVCGLTTAHCAQGTDQAFCQTLSSFCGDTSVAPASAVLSTRVQEQARPLLDTDGNGAITAAEVNSTVNYAIENIGQAVTESVPFKLISTNRTQPVPVTAATGPIASTSASDAHTVITTHDVAALQRAGQVLQQRQQAQAQSPSVATPPATTLPSAAPQSPSTAPPSAGNSAVSALGLSVHGSCAVKDGVAKCWPPTGETVGAFTSDVTDVTSNKCVLHQGIVKCKPAFGSGYQVIEGLEEGVTDIVSSNAGYFTCAVTRPGALKCWQTFTRLIAPARTVAGMESGVTSFSSGLVHDCVVHNGAAKCWQGNSSLSINPNKPFTTSPATIAGLTTGVTQVTASQSHACAIQNGAAKCWAGGDTAYAALGNNSGPRQPNIPVQVEGLTSGVTAISVGVSFSCAVHNGAAKCWGDQARLGNGNAASSHVPVQVQGLTGGVSLVQNGLLHACAAQGSSVYCWGYNGEGQLGNGSVTNGYTLAPVQVQGL